MITLFWTVFFCLGLRTVTDTDMILYFIRKPFEDSYSRMEYLADLQKLKPLADATKRSLLKHKLIVAFGKPFVTCITCMSSIWGASVFIALNGLNQDLVIPLILNSFAASFIQTFIWTLYVRMAV